MFEPEDIIIIFSKKTKIHSEVREIRKRVKDLFCLFDAY